MPIYRVHKENNFTTMANYVFKDKRLSWKAKGILAQLLSLPDDWDFSAAGLESLSADGISATRAALVELEKHGYLTRKAIRDRGKIVDWEYSIYEKPQVEKPQVEKPQVENLQVEKPQVEKPQVENRTQLNTKESSTKESNTKESNITPPAVTKKSREAEQEERFNRFWQSYPRKIQKGAAIKAWAKILPDEELTEKIIEAINKAKKYDYRFREEKYIPHPATWLNAMEWDNQYENKEVSTNSDTDYDNYVPTEDYKLI